MSKSEQQEQLTRSKLVLKLARDIIDFGDDGLIIDLAKELGYKAERQWTEGRNDWTINHGEWHE